MRLYEYEAKELFRNYKIPVLESVIVGDAEDIEKENLHHVVFPVALKAQVLIGGRGKAGGIEFAENIEEAKKKIKALLGMKIHGYEVKNVLVERHVDIDREYYIGVTIDRRQHKPVIIISSRGGVEIEQIAKEEEEAITKYHMEVGESIEPYVGRELARKMGFSASTQSRIGAIITATYKLFLDYDAKLVEINPLVLTKKGEIFALDARVNLDDDALFRHTDLKKMGIGPRHEIGELTAREKIARSAGIPYVDLDGDIGVFPGGAGFGIAAVDLIKKFGGEPANFMDSGGGPTRERMKTMIDLLMNNPKVVVIFGARFGGISRCDEWATAVIQYVRENKPSKPMIMRMAGNMEEKGRELFLKAREQEPELFKNVKVYSFETPIEEVIKETIKVANEVKGKVS